MKFYPIRIQMFLWLAAIFALSFACSNDDDDDMANDDDTANDDDDDTGDDDDDPSPHPAELWPMGDPVTTLNERILPSDPPQPVDTSLPKDEMASYTDYGLDAREIADGEPHLLREELAITTQSDPNERRSLWYLLHLSDTHCLDEETPTRLTGFMDFLESAYRPQEHWSSQLVDMAIRTANGFSGDRPYDFAVVTGDLTDNAQVNEIDWFLTLMDGGELDPDSGADDDPVPGPANDHSDPFIAPGLDSRVPYYVVYGNHEYPLTGSFSYDESLWPNSIGTTVQAVDDNFGRGTRTADTVWGERLLEGEIPADANREFMTPRLFMELMQTSPTQPNGHGFTQENIDRERGYYSVRPTPDLPIRLIGLDTMSQPATSSGRLLRAQWDWVLGELNDAWEAGELVILAQHHPPEKFAGGSEVGPEEYIDTLADYPNVVAVLNGHTHENHITPHASPTGGFWEINTASTIDWPQQFRIVELVDNADGTLSIFATLVDHASLPDSPTDIARGWSLAQFRLFDFDLEFKGGFPEERNVELVWPLPEGWAEEIAGWDGSSKIESLTTLAE